MSALVVPLNVAVPGRARLRAAGLQGNPKLKTALETHLPGRRRVSHVRANAITGNLLLFYDPSVELQSIVGMVETVLSRVNGFHREGASSGKRKEDELPADLSWHTMETEEVVKHWQTSLHTGLSAEEAEKRQAEYGPNALAPPRARSSLSVLLDQFRSLPVILLSGTALLSAVTGGVADAFVIGAVIALNAAIGFATENQAERTVTALLQSPVPEVTLLRDGQEVRVSSQDVVPGDVLVIKRGSEVVADARLVEVHNLTLDQSALTGEGMPIDKHTSVLAERVPLAGRANMVFRETVVTGGSGRAVVVGVGLNTEIGRVHSLIADSARPETPLQRQLAALSSQLLWFTALVSGGVLIVGILRGFAPLAMIRTAVSLGVAAVPEGLPAIATTALANGIRASGRHDVLVRSLGAIESLGSVQVACLDKTGTLTTNRMSVVKVLAGKLSCHVTRDGFFHESKRVTNAERQELDRLVQVSVLCNEAELSANGDSEARNGSSTESALLEMAVKRGIDVDEMRKRYPRVLVVERTENRNYMYTVHQLDNDRRLICAKGSPNEVLALCDTHLKKSSGVSPLKEKGRKRIQQENERFAMSALRVLGMAYAEARPGEKPKLTWIGLVGMEDPTREGLSEVLERLRQAGVTPVMITGDQVSTATAVAQDLNLTGGRALAILDSTELEGLDEDELASRVQGVDVFARVTPSHKLKIVQAYQRLGIVVAMTGDGVNDGPALKAADIGITLGGSGTKLAREVSDVILKNDSIASLIPVIEEGRRIHDNIRKAVHYITSTNSSEILMTLLSLTAGLGQAMNPRQLLWINLLSDVLPELALVTKRAEPGLLDRPPVDSHRSVISRKDIHRLGIEGGVMTVCGMGGFLYGMARYGAGPRATTMAFCSLTSAQLLHALCVASSGCTDSSDQRRGTDRYLAYSVGGGFAALALSLVTPALRRAMGITPISMLDAAVAAVTGFVSLLANEQTQRLLPAPEQQT